MAIEIDGVIHHTPRRLAEEGKPDSPGGTYCGLLYMKGSRFKSDIITCPVCLDQGNREAELSTEEKKGRSERAELERLRSLVRLNELMEQDRRISVDARMAGAKARSMGIPVTDNPHVDIAMQIAWDEGWTGSDFAHRAEAAELLYRALKRMEWYTRDQDNTNCPVCGNFKSSGHTQSCGTAAALRRAERQGVAAGMLSSEGRSPIADSPDPDWDLIAELGGEIMENAGLKERVESLHAELANLREVIIESCDPNGERINIWAPEDGEVQTLCESVGYGAVMDSAYRLWRRKDAGGAKTVGPCVSVLRHALGMERP